MERASGDSEAVTTVMAEVRRRLVRRRIMVAVFLCGCVRVVIFGFLSTVGKGLVHKMGVLRTHQGIYFHNTVNQ